MNLYAYEVNRQLAQAKYRSLRREAESERMSMALTRGRGQRLGRSIRERLRGLVTALPLGPRVPSPAERADRNPNGAAVPGGSATQQLLTQRSKGGS